MRSMSGGIDFSFLTLTRDIDGKPSFQAAPRKLNIMLVLKLKKPPGGTALQNSLTLLRSKRFDHCQNDNPEQKQHRDFIHPAVEHMVFVIAVMLEIL